MRTLACTTALALFVGFACAQGVDTASSAARASVKTQLQDAQDLRTRTGALDSKAYQRPSDLARHRSLVSDLDKTAQLVDRRADALSARDLALSQFYLSEANAKANQLLMRRPAIPKAEVVQLQQTMAPVRQMQTRMQSGQGPFSYRPVTVSVAGANGKPTAQRWRVYVLPAGVLAKPKSFDLDTIEQLLSALTFQELTTPSRGMVAQGEMLLWIGPDAAYEAMARRVMEGAQITYTPLHPAPDGAAELRLSFTAPKDVVQP